MSLRDQAAAFARQGAAFRAELNGTAATYNGATICVSFSGNNVAGRLGDGGELMTFDRIARVRTCLLATAPVTGEALVEVATGLRFRIEKVTTHPVNPEYVLGLMQA